MIFLNHTADLEFEAETERLEDLFGICAHTLFQAMMEEDLMRTVMPRETRNVQVEGTDLESLLYGFLEKLLILHDSERLVFSDFSFKRLEKKNKNSTGWICEYECRGEAWDSARMTSKEHVKAVTYHDMRVERDATSGIWKARVLLDI